MAMYVVLSMVRQLHLVRVPIVDVYAERDLARVATLESVRIR